MEIVMKKMVPFGNATKPSGVLTTQTKKCNMRLSAYCVGVVIVACSTGVASAAKPDHGFALAQRWCAACHLVSGRRH
jgi:mono/diheme cytochrome c family protein